MHCIVVLKNTYLMGGKGCLLFKLKNKIHHIKKEKTINKFSKLIQSCPDTSQVSIYQERCCLDGLCSGPPSASANGFTALSHPVIPFLLSFPHISYICLAGMYVTDVPSVLSYSQALCPPNKGNFIIVPVFHWNPSRQHSKQSHQGLGIC